MTGTPVVTMSGFENIENIKVGDIVLSRDEDTGELVPGRVTRVFVRESAPLLRIVLASGAHIDELETTDEHPFWVEGAGWVAAADLEPGDKLLLAGGSLANVEAVVDEGRTATVYNFEVEGSHTYFVGDLAAWVHNKCWLDKALEVMSRTRDDIMGWMSRPHGHHIIPKGLHTSRNPEIARMVTELQDLAREYGMVDLYHDTRNLAVAPNGMRTHAREGIEAVYNRLIDQGKKGFFTELEAIRNDMFTGEFYRHLGVM